MKNTLLMLLALFTATGPLFAQSDVMKYFNTRLDSLVQRCNTPSIGDEDMTDIAFYRLYAPTLLYESTVRRGLSQGTDIPKRVTSSDIEMDDCRSVLIDAMLLNVYKNYPSLVEMTEEEMRSVLSSDDFRNTQAAPEISLGQTAAVVLPQNVDGALKVKKVRPNYWRTSGSFSFNFTQNYISGNWAQGGENNRTLITGLMFRLNYNDKKKISFENSFEAKLGFVTVSGDTLHSYKTNNDMLRLESKFGYKIYNNINLSAKMTLQTQSMPSYPTNNHNFVSNFMAPFDANFSVGLDYKRSGKGWNLSVYFAPLSSYNYRFVRYGELTSRFGIRNGRHHKEDFGTQIQPTFNATIMKNVTLNSRMEFYTNYSRAYFNWENTIKMKINKYLETTLFMHGRFDDSSSRLYSESYGYWQMKEYFALGLSYTW